MKKNLLYILMVGVLIFQYACKKNDGADGPPVISKVRSVDTTKRDSFFVKSVPGTLIVIQGNNLGGLKQVFFNDTLAYFNPVYATSTNIIVTIPGSAQTVATDPKVPNVIKVVTDHGTVIFPFTLYLPPPAISSITFDNSGSLVYINGYNFQGIKKITFPVPGTADTALSYTVNKTFTQITAVIPPGTAFSDSLRVYCTFGAAAVGYPPPMVVTNISNENATAGTTITITGTNFVGITRVIFPGGLDGTNVLSKSVSAVTVTVPPGITTPDSVRIIGALGTATVPQLFDTYITHPSPGYLSNFDAQNNSDNTGFVGWTGGYAKAPNAAISYPGGTNATAVFLQGSPMANNSGVGSQGNTGFIQLNDVPWVSNTAESISNYSIKFEFYSKNEWSSGAIWVMMGGWYKWHNYLGRFEPWSTSPGGKYEPAGWVTATIPLSKFISVGDPTINLWDLKTFPSSGSPASKFSDYPVNALCFAIINDTGAGLIPANTLEIAIDNIRIVKGH